MRRPRSRHLGVALLVLWAAVARAEPSWAVALEPPERAWIAAHPVVRVALAEDTGPFSFVDERGALAGLAVDYLAEISGKTGLHFELQRTATFSGALSALERRETDVVLPVGKTTERAKLFGFSAPFTFSPDAIVTRTDAPFVFDSSLLGDRRVAFASSSVAAMASFRQRAPTAEVVTYPSMAQAVQAVSRGEVFAAVTDASIAAFTAKRDHLTNVRVSGIFAATDMHVAVRPDWPELVTIIDQVLQAMPAAERARLTNRWVVLDYESDRRWQRAFSVAAVVLGLAALTLVLAMVQARRRASELAVRRKMQAELEAAHAALELVNRDKGVLMRMLAHDLRNPLATLSLNIEALEVLKSLSPEERRGLAGEMRADVRRMVELVETLLDLQAIEDGKRAVHLGRLDLAGLARRAADAMSEAAARKQLTLRVESQSSLAAVESDEAALRQVLDNLLSNALKYSPSGTEVVVKVEGDDARQRVSVRDQGPGVSSEDRSRLFQKYGTGSARPTGGETSTGLGLWICQQLAAALHATLRCDSEPGQGALFTLEVPVRPAR